ncbi:RICIN domain-containing protein [Kitasatospora sp. NPDC087861]|uniref:RICIN domain-containing protein n=1 Tax=Kitasatospora sp. NPDC087861 TaxID=3364070 RepID=UPI00380EBDB0
MSDPPFSRVMSVSPPSCCPRVDTKGYQLRNTSNNRCLALPSWQENGAPAKVWDCVPAFDDQVWKF